MQVIRTYNKEVVIDDPQLSTDGSLICLHFTHLASFPSSPCSPFLFAHVYCLGERIAEL